MSETLYMRQTNRQTDRDRETKRQRQTNRDREITDRLQLWSSFEAETEFII